ncbi:class I SAM-dependent methyltransferase [Poriferisphaera sp. WC338]|uniref:class I SAM-dependent methyltransferase n=1 Tax=Poriferisphaera sp. WC338 TaxID=3425129 RepID=UPI003D8146D0
MISGTDVTYCIKSEYEHRTENTTLEVSEGDYWSPTRILTSHHYQYEVYKLARDLVKQRGLKRVMDVGCGVCHKLAKLVVPVADQVTGIEQPTVVSKAQELLGDCGIDFVSADLERPQDTNLGKFDLIMSVDVIEHMLDPNMLLEFIKAHCHKDTVVLISTPERDVLRGKDNMKSPRAEHVREWSTSEFAAYLTQEGFVVEDQQLLGAFRVGRSWHMMKERFRLFRKGRPFRTLQAAICKIAET